MIDRFIDQGLKIETLRSSNTATRIVQAIGRIFRSNTDHGAVIVCGAELQSWLRDPNNLAFMPKLLQQQVLLGMELRKMIDLGHTTYNELLTGVLEGKADWDELYSRVIADFETTARQVEQPWFMESVEKERIAFQQLWMPNASAAMTEYDQLVAVTDAYDGRLDAWYRHWADWRQRSPENLLPLRSNTFPQPMFELN